MNLERINNATKVIDENSKALKWLQNNKDNLLSSGLFTVRVSIASSFPHTGTGVNEALELISTFAKHNIEKSINDSISNCINTIEIERETILREAGRAALAQEAGK